MNVTLSAACRWRAAQAGAGFPGSWRRIAHMTSVPQEPMINTTRHPVGD